MGWSKMLAILQLGTTGLVFLLALRAYWLLRAEVLRAGSVRPRLLAHIQWFTYFGLAMAAMVAIARSVELAAPRPVEPMSAQSQPEHDPQYLYDLRLLFGDNNGQPRARIVPRTQSDKLLAQKFATARKSIRIVTQTGATWLTADQEPNLRGAVKRDIEVTILLHDYKNQYIFEAIQRSALMSNLPVNGPAHYVEKFNLFARYYAVGSHFRVGVHRFYPWIRFTIFDGTAVSFVFTPLLNSGPGVQVAYSEDPLVLATFETLYKSILAESRIFASGKELTAYTSSKMP